MKNSNNKAPNSIKLEAKETDSNDPENQDPENQDPEIQDPENDVPEPREREELFNALLKITSSLDATLTITKKLKYSKQIINEIKINLHRFKMEIYSEEPEKDWSRRATDNLINALKTAGSEAEDAIKIVKLLHKCIFDNVS